jgi:Flp pilus assembly pilin Flp
MLHNGEDGVAAVEYCFLAALIGLALVVAAASVGASLLGLLVAVAAFLTDLLPR